jgi:hypothetical protein
MKMEILRGQVPNHATHKALFHMIGLNDEELSYPSNRWDPKIMQLLAYLPAQKETELCEPQLVRQSWRSPESDGVSLHKDQEPEWAKGRRYSVIFGVALTPQGEYNGGVIFEQNNSLVQPRLSPGDVVKFWPDQKHCTGIFHAAAGARYSVYFRFLEILPTRSTKPASYPLLTTLCSD